MGRGLPPEDQARRGAEVGAGTLVPFLFFRSYPHTKRWDSFLSTLALDGKPRGGLWVVMGKQSVKLGDELSGQNTEVPSPWSVQGCTVWLLFLLTTSFY